ncbi:hypothetical protein EsH8_VIII_001067 [Colletotrichum jinshuiense]
MGAPAASSPRPRSTRKAAVAAKTAVSKLLELAAKAVAPNSPPGTDDAQYDEEIQIPEELDDGETIKSIELIELVDDSDDDDDPPPYKSVPKALEASEPSKSPNKTNKTTTTKALVNAAPAPVAKEQRAQAAATEQQQTISRNNQASASRKRPLNHAAPLPDEAGSHKRPCLDRGEEYAICAARARHARATAEADVELYDAEVRATQETAKRARGDWSDRNRIWNDSLTEADDFRQFRRDLGRFLKQQGDFLALYGKYDLSRSREQMLRDQKAKRRHAPERSLGSFVVKFSNLQEHVDRNIVLLEQLTDEHRDPEHEEMQDARTRHREAKAKLSKAQHREEAAKKWIEELKLHVDAYYPIMD